MTVTNEETPPSFLETRCLQQLTEENMINYSKTATVIGKDFYMDDILTGTDSVEKLIQLKKRCNINSTIREA